MKCCETCKHYHEIEPGTFDQGGIFPGRGHCWRNPPTVYVDEGKVYSAVPEVLALDCCSRYHRRVSIFSQWAKRLRSIISRDGESEGSNP